MQQQKTATDTALSSPIARAQRLKRIRNMANLSRKMLCEKGNINLHTLIGWENGRFGGLTLLGAQKVIEKVSEEGVVCSMDWLMHGIGPDPTVNAFALYEHVSPENLALDNAFSKHDEDLAIAYELSIFKSTNENAIHLVVKDDSMEPQYNIGDHVAGKKRTGNKINAVIGYDCIVETKQGEVLLRNLRQGPDIGTYNLVCNNSRTMIKESILYGVELVSAAPVIWHRKKDIENN